MTQTLSLVVTANIRAEAARNRRSHAELAQAAGMSQWAMSRRLNGLLPFTVDEVEAIAAALQVPLSALLGPSA